MRSLILTLKIQLPCKSVFTSYHTEPPVVTIFQAILCDFDLGLKRKSTDLFFQINSTNICRLLCARLMARHLEKMHRRTRLNHRLQSICSFLVKKRHMQVSALQSHFTLDWNVNPGNFSFCSSSQETIILLIQRLPKNNSQRSRLFETERKKQKK